MARLLGLLLIVIILGTGGFFGWRYVYGHGEAKAQFTIVTVDKGDIVTTITATGTIEPEEVIDVGAQVLGMIKEFGPDPHKHGAVIDYDSRVEEGTVLARIDESLYRAAVEQATANLHQAEAKVNQAEADLESMKSKLVQTKRDWDRIEKFKSTKALSEFEVDAALNAYESARAAVTGGQAALETARKQVEVNRAALATAKINLNYCTIISPVKGVIIDRRVNIGQTVVASLSAPSLFLIAKDLARLQVWASVNEADIGQIRAGQSVNFRVAAFPGERFPGTVTQVRLNATMTSNVVTYTVVVSTENPKGRLLPYMTATIDFEVGRRTSVLRVPSAALRWQPAAAQIAPDLRGSFDLTKNDTSDQSRVWVVDGEFLRSLKVHTGLSDGVSTEVVNGKLVEGTPVVVAESAGDTGGGVNPFAPKLPAKK